MKPIVIFGAGDIARLAHYYFTGTPSARCGPSPSTGLPPRRRTPGPSPRGLRERLHSFPPRGARGVRGPLVSGHERLRALKYEAMKASATPSRATSEPLQLFRRGAAGDNCFILEDNTVQPFVTHRRAT